MTMPGFSESSSKSVVVVGAGGNIGSHLVSHLGRMAGIGRITLVDRDVYETANLVTQNITLSEVGRRKAVVQARRLRRIRSSLAIVWMADEVEHVPLGLLRCDVILACLDSRRARQYVNQAAWRLGVPWIDAGVEGSGLLARVNVYVPGPDSPCLECAWDQRDYETLEQTYPCSGMVVDEPAPSNSPSSLGALAASLQAIECEKMLRGETDRAAIGRQVLVDSSHHKLYVTAFRRTGCCRSAGHEVWRIEKLNHSPDEITIGQVLELYAGAAARNGAPGLRVDGKPFVRKLTCTGCGGSKRLLRLEASLRPVERRCARCGQAMVAAGFDVIERLDAITLPKWAFSRSLRSIGLRPGDVLSIGDASGETHVEIGGDRT